MNIFKADKPIFTSLSPNTQRDDIFLSLKIIFQFWKWKKGNAVSGVENWFRNYLKSGNVFSFNSGRSALLAILNSLDLKDQDEILLQGFTCNASVNPILKLKAKPVFVDIDDVLNINPDDLIKKITPRSKAIIIQHTFGWPARMDEILEIAKDNNLFVVEDCAHSLGVKYEGELCGTFGDAAFFSFGRDKIISSVFGGLAVIKDKQLAQKISTFQEKIEYPSYLWIFQQLLHPFLTNYIVIPVYQLSATLGRLMLGFLHVFLILSKAVYKNEKKGEFVEQFPKKFPNALAILALNQLKKLEEFNQHRKIIADFYRKELSGKNFILPFNKERIAIEPIFMRYPVLVNFDTDYILKQGRKRNIFLDDGWRKSPVVPVYTLLEKMNYQLGSCPKAEKVAQEIINLPTHINISQKEAQKIIDLINGS
ncbi:MAG: aminotransferase class V-fold PLP-dependent enzyme [Patescibacteria group bacterium]